jgi:hypothetical protein
MMKVQLLFLNIGGICAVETTTTQKYMETRYIFTSLVRGQPAEHSQIHFGMLHFDMGVHPYITKLKSNFICHMRGIQPV